WLSPTPPRVGRSLRPWRWPFTSRGVWCGTAVWMAEFFTFHLAGLNHQNSLMADEETRSWWQQSSGECILGPQKGKRLRRIPSDEVALAVWRSEHPESTAVKFDPRYRYPGSDWEKRLAWEPSGVTDVLQPRDLVVGIEMDRAAAA